MAAEPTKVLVFSAEDYPALPATLAGLRTPLVVEHDGLPHQVRVSRYVRAGDVLAFDLAALDHALPTPPEPAGCRHQP